MLSLYTRLISWERKGEKLSQYIIMVLHKCANRTTSDGAWSGPDPLDNMKTSRAPSCCHGCRPPRHQCSQRKKNWCKFLPREICNSQSLIVRRGRHRNELGRPIIGNEIRNPCSKGNNRQIGIRRRSHRRSGQTQNGMNFFRICWKHEKDSWVIRPKCLARYNDGVGEFPPQPHEMIRQYRVGAGWIIIRIKCGKRCNFVGVGRGVVVCVCVWLRR